MDIIYFNGRFQGSGINQKNKITACAIRNKRFLKFGSDAEIMKLKSDETRLIDLQKKTVIPGLNDSHLHLIRGGLTFNMELRWDGIQSLSDAMAMLKEQVSRTPPPQWVRVVGGWSEFQFKEKRLPTLAELNAISTDTPIFILHLYDRALLNQAALRAIGYDKNTQEIPGTVIERDKQGNPTGMLIASPNAFILYSTLAKGPKLAKGDQINSTLHFMRELNRLGLTSLIDAGGGFQNFPDDYQVIQQLSEENKLTIRIAYHLFTQRPNHELEDYENWTKTTRYKQGDEFYRHNGAGEMLVFSAADFEDFLRPRPDLPSQMETQLEAIVRLLAKNSWAFRLHATYDESIQRALNVFEKVNHEIPFDQLHWFFDHAETISDESIERTKKLNGGIAIQNRIAFQGEYFLKQYGKTQTLRSPPIQKILAAGVPIGMGTDGTRVSSYNPWLCLYWLTTGKSIGGTQLYDENNILTREKALELYTQGSAWFSDEQKEKGSLVENQFADFAVLSQNYFTIPDEEIKNIYSLMTVVGGEIVHASDQFSRYNPTLPAVTPDWAPIKYFGTYGKNKFTTTVEPQMLCSTENNFHDHWGNCLCWAF